MLRCLPLSSLQVWDLESMGCKRTIAGHATDVLSLCVSSGMIYRCVPFHFLFLFSFFLSFFFF